MLGCGASGQAAARLLLGRGYAVTVLDGAAEERIGEAAAALRALGATVLCGEAAVLPKECLRRKNHATDKNVCATICCVSPGIAWDAAWCGEAAARGAEVVAELEVGARALAEAGVAMVAVTGSKGKSSVVKLIADTLALSGRSAVACGNYGTALCDVALKYVGASSSVHQDTPVGADLCVRPGEGAHAGAPLRASATMVAVVECSSFQLEGVRGFRPRVAAVLNVSADHLDRHGSISRYRDIKLRVFESQGEGDVALLPSGDDPYGIREAFGRLYPGRRYESFGVEAEAAWRYGEGRVTGGGVCVDVGGTYFDNAVLGRAAAAAVAVLCHAGLSAEEIEAGFRRFVPLPHRMQCVGMLQGVTYINDSKATSFAAQLAALSMVKAPVRLIAGGRLKEREIPPVKKLVTSGVVKVYLIGECASVLMKEWGDGVGAEICGTLEQAVERAARDAHPGETVLLSPGTASFDQFTNYQERGDVFTRWMERKNQ